jgi:hypothetical protein
MWVRSHAWKAWPAVVWFAGIMIQKSVGKIWDEHCGGFCCWVEDRECQVEQEQASF